MGKVSAEIGERQAAWIEQQHLFFVGTAPSSIDGPPRGFRKRFRA